MPANAHVVLAAEGRTPERLMLFLHGIIGRGSNLRTVARRVASGHPRWGAVLVDLRMHGASRGFAPPHTVAAAALDLLALEGSLAAPVRGVVGHSFGGKVALAYLELAADRLDHVVVVDASPSAHGAHADTSTRAALDVLASLPSRLPSRAALVEHAVAAGLDRSLGEWLAMNLERRDGGFGLSVDLGALRAMLDDYLRLDLWPLVESLPGHAVLDVVIAERGGVYSPADRERLARAAAAQPHRLRVHTMATGHWVHADDPDGLARIVVAALAPGEETR